jgi:hypothetical protein
VFKDFSVSMKGASAYLQWNTASSASTCIVEHSIEGNSWNEVGRVTGYERQFDGNPFHPFKSPHLVKIITG